MQLDPDYLKHLLKHGNGDHSEEPTDGLPVPIDWDALYARENDIEWLIEDVWPQGRQLHIFAARKTGKSLLMLWFAANLATGRCPLTGKPRERIRVAYLDYEMTEDDLLERVEEMGFKPDDLRNWLIYYLWPALPALDTNDGGLALIRLVERDQATAVVIDTMSRVTQGEENSADTYQAFFMFTGMRLKRQGISLTRLDHEGHESGRSRGSSAKADDVDVVFRLTAADGGALVLTKKAARMSWIPETVELARIEPLGYRQTNGSWPAGTKDKADELDAIKAPVDISRRTARALLEQAGKHPGRNEILQKAIQYRRSLIGDHSGTTTYPQLGPPLGTTSANGGLPGVTTSGDHRGPLSEAKGVGPPYLVGDHPPPEPKEMEPF